MGAFIRLWVSFNTWYNDQSNHRSEQRRVIEVGKLPDITDRYWLHINHLSDPAHNDNYKHIIDTVVDASTTEYKDSSGNPVKMKTDSTGFRYRLRCNRTNVHTEFLRECVSDPLLRDWSHGIVQFNTKSRQDELFRSVYVGYKDYMRLHLHLPYNVFDDIPNELSRMGIEQFGCTLFHKLGKSQNNNSTISSLQNILGPNFLSLQTKASKYRSQSAVRKAFPTIGNKGKLYRWHEASGLDILQRELLLLYKLRSSIIHGDRDHSPNEQRIARAAYNALDDLMVPIFQ